MRKLSLVPILSEAFSKREKGVLSRLQKREGTPNTERVISYLERMPQKDFERINMASKYPIAHGGHALIMSSADPLRVLKITDVPTDYNIANRIRGIPGINPIHRRWKLEDGIYCVESDNVNQLPPKKRRILDRIEKFFNDRGTFTSLSARGTIIRDFIKNECSNEGPEEMETAEAVARLIRHLASKKMGLDDFKADQFMIDKEGQLVLVDYGCIREFE